MNPDKLFDYLDGTLPEYEREEVERNLATDRNLQRQLAIAREIHKGMRESREIILPTADEERSGRIGRRVGAAFMVLVFVNVLIGIAFIIGNKRPTKQTSPQVREQVSTSVQKAAEAAMPPPTLADEVAMFAPAAERDRLADQVVAAAEQCGGSAAKALPNETMTTVIAEIPSVRENEFRLALVPLGAPPPLPPDDTTPAPNARVDKLIQVQIKTRENAAPSASATP